MDMGRAVSFPDWKRGLEAEQGMGRAVGAGIAGRLGGDLGHLRETKPQASLAPANT